MNRATCTLAAFFSLSSISLAQTQTAYELLPDNTQGVVWIRSGDELAERWSRTQLAKLMDDKAIAPFFEEQRQEIEKRFMEAGWRLSVKPADLSEYVIGQIAIAWATKKDVPLKPFSLALVAEVGENQGLNDRMMGEIEKHLNPQKTKKQEYSYAGTTITKYSLPPRAGELISQDSYFAIVGGLLLSSDDEPMIKQLIDNAQGNGNGKVIAQEEDFIRGRQLAEISGAGQLEYFIRPLGFARVIRSIGGNRSKSSSDMLTVLENQGFGAIQCICGEVEFGQDELDIRHHGYVYAKRPLDKSAKLLDFPNHASQQVPNFVGANISSFLATYWNAKEAFWHTEGLVDEIAGQQGVFKEVVEGIKKDPNGPRIDIENEVLPLFTNDIFSITDSKEGDAEVDSRRNMIALKVNDSKAMAKVLNKAMNGEPDAELVEFEGVEIWKVVHRDDEIVIPEGIGSDFNSDFGPPPPAPADDGEEPWLSNWAICVSDDYLMFASHVEMIEEAIQLGGVNNQSPLLDSADYQRVESAIQGFTNQQQTCAWQLMRNKEAYRVQYELFRKGELRRSQSMAASLLDRLLQNDSEIRSKDQKIQGKGLPPFEAISGYLQPGGLMARSTDEGWEFGSLLLAPAPNGAAPAANPVTGSGNIGTAQRSSHIVTENKR